MKKLKTFAGVILGAWIIFSNCACVSVTPVFRKYKTIHVGWLDLGEDNYAFLGYLTKDEWRKEIKAQNIECLQYYLRRYMSGWKVTGAASKDAAYPQDPETILIKFSYVQLNSMILRCRIEFYDSVSGNLLKQAIDEPMMVSFQPYSGRWVNMSLGGRLMNAMYSLAYDIKYYMQK